MPKRLILLIALIIAVGYCTQAFAVQASNGSEPLTRASAVALLMNADSASLARAQWYASHMPPMPLFDDIDQNAWYAPYLEVAFEQGIITGNRERTFRPNEALREEEAIALVTRYKQSRHPVEQELVLQIPGTQGNWLNKVVSEARASAIAMPFPVRVGSPITRSAYSTMIGSAGVRSPESLTVASLAVVRPGDTAVQVAKIQPITTKPAPTTTRTTTQYVARPTTTQNTNRPTATQTAPTTVNRVAVSAPATSTKSFAISMPGLGIKDLSITHPSSFTSEGLLAPLKYGVGHLFSYPGQGGKILVYGHSSSFPWDVSNYTKIFRQINKLNVGDMIYVTYNGKQYTYKVSYKQAVDAGDMTAYAQTGSEELILYTCWPPDSIKQRYLVHAVPVAE